MPNVNNDTLPYSATFKTITSGAIMRVTYNASSAAITTIPGNTYVETSKVTNDNTFYYITYNGKSGWVNKIYLTKVLTAAGTTSTCNKRLTTTGSAPIKEIYSSTAKVVITVQKDVNLVATKVHGTYYYVTYGGKSGWISSQYVKDYVPPTVGGNTGGTTTNPDPGDDNTGEELPEYNILGIENATNTGISYDDLSSYANGLYSAYKNYTLDELLEAVAGDEAAQAEREELLAKYMSDFAKYDSEDANKAIASKMNGIFGMPYQFNSLVDPKVEGTDFGWKFTEKIASKMPLLIVSPGKVEYMPGQTKMSSIAALTDLAKSKFRDLFDANDSNDLSQILNGNGKYYGFQYAWQEYYEFVNVIAHAGSIFLGISDVTINIGGHKNKLKYFDWSKAMTNDFGNYINAQESLVFYVDGLTSVTDTFSNTTTESQLASKVNSFSDVGKEIAFLVGTQAGLEFENLMDVDKITSSIDGIAGKYFNGNQLFKDIGSEFATIASGGKLLFPEIWDDSKFDRSFDISIKLRTPDNDVLSWYLNIYIPMCFMIALAAPQQNTKNGYYSPFLVKGNYKGLFNVDMGLITSLSFNKGKEGAWTLDGRPTEVDVSMTITDLYQSVLSIVSQSHSDWFLSNTALMDYIATLCGININKPDIERTFEIYLVMQKDKRGIKNNISRKWQALQESFTNNILYKGYQKLFT